MPGNRLNILAVPHPFAGDVSAGGAEALGEGAHQDVHVTWVQAKIIDHAPAPRAQRPDAVSLVQVEVRPVALLQGDDLGQPHHAALHAAEREAVKM